jgi:hypothetical protein
VEAGSSGCKQREVDTTSPTSTWVATLVGVTSGPGGWDRKAHAHSWFGEERNTCGKMTRTQRLNRQHRPPSIPPTAHLLLILAVWAALAILLVFCAPPAAGFMVAGAAAGAVGRAVAAGSGRGRGHLYQLAICLALDEAVYITVPCRAISSQASILY